MNHQLSGADARAASGRSKLRLLLTAREVECLDGAVQASGSWTRSLLIEEAVRAGLAEPELRVDNGRRLRRIDITVPAKLVEGVRRFALEHGMSQQQLLRYLLFKYLAAAPWEQAETVSVEVAR